MTRSQNAMRSIPLEILNEILTHVAEDSVDVTHFRCTCTTFAALGLPFALRKVTIYAHHGHLDNLRAVAYNPVKSRYVKSLTFIPWYFPVRDRGNASESSDQKPDLDGEYDDEFFRDTVESPNPVRKFFVDAHDIENASRKEPMTAELVSRALADINPSHGTNYNKKYAPITFFTSPTKRNIPWHLDRSNINYYNGCRRITGPRLRVDIPEYRPPHTRARSWLCSRGRLLGPRGTWPRDVVLGALQKSDNRTGITSLKVDGDDWASLVNFTPLAMVSQLASLREIDLEFVTETPHHKVGREWGSRLLYHGHLRDFLAALPNLEHLSVNFSPMEPRRLTEREPGPHLVPLGTLMKAGHRWPALKSLSLTGIMDRGENYLAMFELHRSTLKKIELWCLYLAAEEPGERSWIPFLQALQQMLGTRGCELVICGDAIDWRNHAEVVESLGDYDLDGGGPGDNLIPVRWKFGLPEHVLERPYRLRQKLSAWFVQGGEIPLYLHDADYLMTDESQICELPGWCHS
ncbi:hypothetical protein QBC37DRAFT_452424 [Rhypophila decipiens]|uniref:Uncharacterized protein n=1 Tax=Rhypophila decipiens TaxID=261697 RepID=A0AAN6Y1R7_9PEZI|nr:hypothetical protein QBC37DRAFT_452424 [Rhypophila decipiens]